MYARIGTFCQDNNGEITYISRIFKFESNETLDEIISSGLEKLDKYYEGSLPEGYSQIDLLEIIERMDSISETDKYIDTN